MRRIAPRWWMRIRSGWRAGLKVWVPMVGVLGALRAAVAAEVAISTRVVVAVAVGTVLVAVIVAYFRGHLKMLPDSFVEEVGSDGVYRCEVTTREELQLACELTRPYYGHEFVEHERVEQWRLANTTAFECLKNRDGDLCASFGILPLNDSFMDLFVDGRIEDLKLQAKDIMSPSQARQCVRIYISGVVVRDPSRMVGRKRACVMSWAMLMHVKRVYGLRKQREMYAIAVTPQSERLMRNLGFKMVGGRRQRVDRCDLFRYTLNRASWQQLLAHVGDFSAICTIG